jgi:hypothetical protein
MKKLLCIVELENTLLMTKCLNSPFKVFGGDVKNKPFDASKDGVGIHFRRGREDLLQAMFKRVIHIYERLPKLWSTLYGLVWTGELQRLQRELTLGHTSKSKPKSDIKATLCELYEQRSSQRTSHTEEWLLADRPSKVLL